jgi:hypothetical protein
MRLTPPGTDEAAMTTTAASPPKRTQNCATSFQMTASMPPRAVYSVTSRPRPAMRSVSGMRSPVAVLIARDGT